MINKYDFREIGRRIKKERKKLIIYGKPATLEVFADKIGVTRQTLSKWEKGDTRTSPSLLDFLNMCRLFNCDLGYLLCEYNCKTRDATDVCKATGLTENAICRIQREGKDNPQALAMLDELLNNLQFWVALEDMATAAESYSKPTQTQFFDDPRLYAVGFSEDELINFMRNSAITSHERYKLHLFHASSNFTEAARDIVNLKLRREKTDGND